MMEIEILTKPWRDCEISISVEIKCGLNLATIYYKLNSETLMTSHFLLKLNVTSIETEFRWGHNNSLWGEGKHMVLKKQLLN